MSFRPSYWYLLISVLISACPANPICTESSQCGPFATCGADGRCVQGCSRDDQCSEGEQCRDGTCARACEVDGECEAGERCAEGRCTPGCSATAPCPGGSSCREGVCGSGCVVDGDCTAGNFCNGSGECEPFGAQDAGTTQCLDHGDCRVGEYCTDARQCRVGCRDHNACPLGFFCGDDHRCVPGDPPAPSDAGPGTDGGGAVDGGSFALNCGVLGQENVAPQVVVWREFTLYAEDPDGSPLTRVQWILESGAGGDGLRIQQPGDSSTVAQVPRVGSWTFRVAAFRANGALGTCLVTLASNPPSQGFFFQLAWEGDRDLDLHLVPLRHTEACESDDDCEGAGRQCNLSYCSMAFNTQTGTDSDCWARQAEPDWSAEEAPRYVHDVREGAGTEYIQGARLAPEHSYRVAVRTFGNRTNSAALTAWNDGQVLVPTQDFRLGPAGGEGWYYVGRLSPTANGLQWVSVGEASRDVPRN